MSFLKDSKNIKFIIYVSIVIGIIGGFIKLGWEVPFPPRTELRNITNPPQALLELLGFSFDFTHMTYTFSGYNLPIVSFIVHFIFSITCAFFYVYFVSNKAVLTIKKAILFGVIICILFHVIIMPILGVVPSPINQPIEEHLSEFFGHIIWLYVMELSRYALFCNKIENKNN